MNDIRDLNAWHSIDEAKARCQAFAESLEFPYFLVTLRFLRPPSQLVRAAITSLPREWLNVYEARRYYRINPAAAHLRQSMAPFSWDEIERESLCARRFHAAASEHGVSDGLTVPVQCAGGEILSLSLAGRPVPRDADERWILFGSCYRFLSPGAAQLRRVLMDGKPHAPWLPLTANQREILLLLMQGRSVKEIARSLDLHVRTVEGRLLRACERLKANSREQAMVRALATRQIEMLSDQLQPFASVETYSLDCGDPSIQPRSGAMQLQT